jgi:hypothetical protein
MEVEKADVLALMVVAAEKLSRRGVARQQAKVVMIFIQMQMFMVRSDDSRQTVCASRKGQSC